MSSHRIMHNENLDTTDQKKLQILLKCLTIPANCETSMKKAKAAAQIPVKIVLLTGTWVLLLTSEKKGGNNPSLAIAISILGWGKAQQRSIISAKKHNSVILTPSKYFEIVYTKCFILQKLKNFSLIWQKHQNYPCIITSSKTKDRKWQ